MFAPTKFPFLSESLVRVEDNRLALFKYVFPVRLKRPETLSFLGYIQPLGAINPIAEVQARWVVQLLLGNVRLPTKVCGGAPARERNEMTEYRLHCHFAAYSSLTDKGHTPSTLESAMPDLRQADAIPMLEAAIRAADDSKLRRTNVTSTPTAPKYVDTTVTRPQTPDPNLLPQLPVACPWDRPLVSGFHRGLTRWRLSCGRSCWERNWRSATPPPEGYLPPRSSCPQTLRKRSTHAFPRFPPRSPTVCSIREAVAGLELVLGSAAHIRAVWVPGHAGIEGNEAAHRLARAFLSLPSAGQPLLRPLDAPSGSDASIGPSPPQHPRNETKRRLSTRLPECPTSIPRGYPRAAEVRLRRITTGCAWTPYRLARFGLRSPEHAICDRCSSTPTSAPQANQTAVLITDTSINAQSSAHLATLRHLLWECPARRKERHIALAQLGPPPQMTFELWTAPTGPTDVKRRVFNSLLAYVRTAGLAGLL
ncbi:hypothetical protein HPB47_027177 [Ixodes persulcatus]|uniref:Uncharacterized protein n=1 Tax=Ixodes persulcatus TaxID=34615 RepID=A0AC60PZ12_IXOPE|nr:hypothetical protein HPB47_027177 [Ixodes persulcatus]